MARETALARVPLSGASPIMGRAISRSPRNRQFRPGFEARTEKPRHCPKQLNKAFKLGSNCPKSPICYTAPSMILPPVV
eukprot:663563-Rhodomonas_salina.1